MTNTNEIPYTDIIPHDDPKNTPERYALALLRAQQLVASSTAKEHERDVHSRLLGMISDVEYRANEADRRREVDEIKVFFNPMVGDFCIEDYPEHEIPCGVCRVKEPSDPCRECGLSQPVSIDDYFRANQSVICCDELKGGTP